MTTNRRLMLLAVGVPSLLTGAWLRLDPRGFYDTFPGFGQHWISALGPYDGHALTDYGAALAGLSVALLAIALLPRARALPVVLGAWLVAAVPHLLYHVFATGPLSAGANAANLTLLGLSVALPAAVLVAERRGSRPGTRPPTAAAAPSGNGRMAMAPERGIVRRFAYRASRRMLGRMTTPVGITGHHPGLLVGYGLFEMASDRADRVPGRVKQLATLRAAMLVGCEYCLDIGSALSRAEGVTEDELRALARWRESDRFSALDRLALAYAEAMTRTPAVIDDELFDGLRAHLDEPQLVELTSVIALENYRARFNWAFGIGADGFSEGAYCVAPAGRPDVTATASAT